MARLQILGFHRPHTINSSPRRTKDKVSAVWNAHVASRGALDLNTPVAERCVPWIAGSQSHMPSCSCPKGYSNTNADTGLTFDMCDPLEIDRREKEYYAAVTHID